MERPAYTNELGQLLRSGDFDRLLQCCRENMEHAEAQVYPESAYVRQDLGRAYYELEQYAAAELEYGRALEIHRQHGCTVSADAAYCLGMLGNVARRMRRPEEAKAAWSEALVLFDHVPAGYQAPRGFILLDRALMHIADNELDTAEHLLHEAARHHVRYDGYCLDYLAMVFANLSCVYERRQQFDIANKAMRKAFRYFDYYKDDEPYGYAVLLTSRGVLQESQGKLASARQDHAEALKILLRVRPQGCSLLDRVQRRVAKLDAAVSPTTSIA